MSEISVSVRQGRRDVSLAEALPNEIDRCEELLQAYREIPQGAFAAASIAAEIKEAKKAALGGDVVAMLRAFLSECS